MPADRPGVTTDDQGPRPGGDEVPSPAADRGRDAPRAHAGATDGGGSAAPAPAGEEDPTGHDWVDTRLPASGPPSGASRAGGPDVDAPGTPPSGADSTAQMPSTPPDDTATGRLTADPNADPGADTQVEVGPPAPAPGAGDDGAPPAPDGASGLRDRGRRAMHAARSDRADSRGLRVNQRLWSIDPWSVFKLSALFYFCLGLIIVVAATLLYNAGRSVGTIDQFESFITRMGAYGECTPKTEVDEGAEFEEDDKCDEGEVLVGGFALDDGMLFRAGAIGVTILVVAGSVGNLLLTILVNLLNELTGGLRHTVIKEPVVRSPGRGTGPVVRSPGRGPAAARRPPGRPPGGSRPPEGRPPSGSPAPRSQG